MEQKQNSGKPVTTFENQKNVAAVKTTQNMLTEKKENTAQTLNKSKAPTYEELIKRLEELEEKNKRKPANLDDVIKFYQVKKEKINQLQELKNFNEELNTAKEKVNQDIIDGAFNGKNYQLIFCTYSDYRNGDAKFKVSNSQVLLDCINFLQMQLKTRISQIEIEIKADY